MARPEAEIRSEPLRDSMKLQRQTQRRTKLACEEHSVEPLKRLL